MDKDKPLKVGVLFGGRSGEYEVSLVSGATVMSHLDPQKYQVYALGIGRDGSFVSARETGKMLGSVPSTVIPVQGTVTSSVKGRLMDITAHTESDGLQELDVFFPVLHGPFGEDGTMQGLLEMTGCPYVGCGVAVSSCGMDKELTKRLLRDSGLSVIPYHVVYGDTWKGDTRAGDNREALREQVVEEALRKVGAPWFVKPCRMGSSVGISKVDDESSLAAALDLALQYDYKVLVEKALEVREFECSVMGNREIQVSHPGEILPSREFYDYSAKYLDGDASKLLIPAPISEELTEHLMDLAAQAFSSLGGEGFARVDFLQDKNDGDIYINEINTIPGFTEISMFPKLWGYEGLPIGELLDRLIELALERHRWKSALTVKRTPTPTDS